MRILVAEDDVNIRDLVRDAVLGAGLEVEIAGNGVACLDLTARMQFDAAIIDLGLPDMDGMELIRQLRASGFRSPVLILSARRSVDEKVLGLEHGGDDYLTKPFAIAELLARLRNLLNSSTVTNNPLSSWKVMDLEMNLVQRTAARGGESLTLSPMEFAILEHLCRHAGELVTRSTLLAEVWGMRFVPDTNIVDVHIYRLRAKVDCLGREPLIKTLRGRGYILRKE